MRRSARVMRLQPLIKGGSDACVALAWNCEAWDEIDAVHEIVPLCRYSEICFGGQFPLELPPGLLPKFAFGLPAEASAKAGGGQGSRTPDPYVANVVLSQLS